MNNNKKVFALILVFTTTYLIFSVYLINSSLFKNINLISEILDIEKKAKNKSIAFIHLPINDYNKYQKKGTLVHFKSDSIKPALTKFVSKLIALSENKKCKIRIAWFGDSQIEGDLITQELREMLQNDFSLQKGVGYIPLSCVSSDFRTTASIKLTGNLKIDNFKNNNNNSNLFLSGYSFFCKDLNINFCDKIKKNNTQNTQKYLLYGKGDSILIKINNLIKKYPAEKSFNRILLDNSPSNGIQFQLRANNTPIYGISSEPEFGIVLDNFSFRGITGVELKKVNDNLLREINKSGYYDLAVFQYGVNLMFRPNDSKYDYYYKIMSPVLRKFKNNTPDTELLLLSCSDRAFKYDGQWKTAVGIDSLLNTQAKLAYDNDVTFYNLYQSMGGKGTIVKWADSTVSYANKDYIHFNRRGANAVAKIIYKAIMNDYNKGVKIKQMQKRNFKKEIEL